MLIAKMFRAWFRIASNLIRLFQRALKFRRAKTRKRHTPLSSPLPPPAPLPLPKNERDRLKAVERYQFLENGAEEAFDDLTALAAQICGTPICLISLVGENRQWFKSKVGVEVTEIPRSQSFCSHAILEPNKVMVVPNASQDQRFASNPLVTFDPNIRFYAGTPLLTPDGFPLGTLCVLDSIPRNLTPKQLEGLRLLGRQAIYQMELRLKIERLESQIKRRQKAKEELKLSDQQVVDLLETMTDGFFALDNEWRFTYLNQRAGQILQIQPENTLQKRVWEVFNDTVGSSFESEFRKAVEQQGTVSFEEFYAPLHRWFEVRAFPSYQGLSVFLHDITQRKMAELALQQQKEKSERLLLNILPASIAEELKQEPGIIAQHHDDTTILFADLVNFTQLARGMSAKELVLLLNELFFSFDRLTETYALEKIKTIGDAYMVATGLPEPRHDHAEAIADMALAMRQTIQDFNATKGTNLNLSIGINTGPVVAGVIGMKKFTYDLWGDTVNMASRMQSHALPGQIQVTETTYEKLKQQYSFTERGVIEVKGFGSTKTYLLGDRLSPQNQLP